ncbi:MAG: hypothetical protein IJQ58_05955 [Synergistaceae bacterium]|nr:hypothetical protein [Synergistaceae bacterium]
MELYELNLWMLIEGLKSGKFSAPEVFDSCKKRIDKCEGNIHALITRTDDKTSDFSTEGTFAGIPTILKDNLCTKGIRTTAASKILGNW